MTAHKIPHKIPHKLDSKPAQHSGQQSHIVVVTREELDRLGDILDNPFLTLTDQQRALFVRGYRLVRI